jgi:hypothetical protein
MKKEVAMTLPQGAGKQNRADTKETYTVST